MFIGCITNKQTRVFEPTMEGMYNDIIGEFRNTINNLCATNVCIPLYTRLRGMIHTSSPKWITHMRTMVLEYETHHLAHLYGPVLQVNILYPMTDPWCCYIW